MDTLDNNFASAQTIGLARVADELGVHDAAPAHQLAPLTVIPTALPAYVKHNEDATRSGMLSAHTIVLEFETTAAELEKLGEELKAAQSRAEEDQATLARAIKDLTATAKAYREEAARVFDRVERVTTQASEASLLCAQLRSKIASDV